VLVGASAVGYYGDRGDEALTEDAAPGPDFLAQLCLEWERAALDGGARAGLRACVLRTGVVLDRRGGALAKMLPPFRLGAGGPVAGGRQFMSWIALADLVAMYTAAVDDERWSGAFNATGPAPVRNGDFARSLGRALHRPAFAPVPAAALRLLYGEMAQIVTDSQNALPARALELGFELDRTCLVEPSVEGGIEVNCAVIGRPGVEPRASLCEQPVAAESFLSFEDKYMGGAKNEGMKGAQRLIPAPLPDGLTSQVQDLAKRAFTAFGCAGVTRVDFLIDAQQRVYVNELNTIPGSFSFYLWEPAGLPFVDLMDELIDFALAEQREKLRTTTVFATNLLAQRASGSKTGEKA